MTFKERLEGYKNYGRFCAGIIIIYVIFMICINVIYAKWDDICEFFGKIFKKNDKKDDDFDV